MASTFDFCGKIMGAKFGVQAGTLISVDSLDKLPQNRTSNIVYLHVTGVPNPYDTVQEAIESLKINCGLSLIVNENSVQATVVRHKKYRLPVELMTDQEKADAQKPERLLSVTPGRFIEVLRKVTIVHDIDDYAQDILVPVTWDDIL